MTMETLQEIEYDGNELVNVKAKKSAEVYRIPVAQQLIVLGIVLLLIFGTTVAPHLIALVHKVNSTSPIPEKSINVAQTVESTKNVSSAFSDVHLAAKAAYVWDIKNQKVLYKKNETEALPLASITKLMTALVAQEVLNESDPVKINAVSVAQEGNSGLAEGETFNRQTLSDFSLMSSSNDGAFALAAAAGNILVPNNGANAFVTAMNIRAKEIGLNETSYKNPTGLDISTTEAGAYGSARDMAFLMEYIIKNDPNILTYTRENAARMYSNDGISHDAENTNEAINKIPGLIGSKTGYTDLAGGNLAIGFDAGLDRPIAAVVLGSSEAERFTDMLQLVKDTQAYIANESPK